MTIAHSFWRKMRYVLTGFVCFFELRNVFSNVFFVLYRFSPSTGLLQRKWRRVSCWMLHMDWMENIVGVVCKHTVCDIHQIFFYWFWCCTFVGGLPLEEPGEYFLKINCLEKCNENFVKVDIIANDYGGFMVVFRRRSTEAFPYRIENLTSHSITFHQQDVCTPNSCDTVLHLLTYLWLFHNNRTLRCSIHCFRTKQWTTPGTNWLSLTGLRCLYQTWKWNRGMCILYLYNLCETIKYRINLDKIKIRYKQEVKAEVFNDGPTRILKLEDWTQEQRDTIRFARHQPRTRKV